MVGNIGGNIVPFSGGGPFALPEVKPSGVKAVVNEYQVFALHILYLNQDPYFATCE